MAITISSDALDALYRKLKPKGVTMTALLAKAAGVALESHPLLYACEAGVGVGWGGLDGTRALESPPHTLTYATPTPPACSLHPRRQRRDLQRGHQHRDGGGDARRRADHTRHQARRQHRHLHHVSQLG